MAGSSGCRNEKVALLFAHSESVGPQRALGGTPVRGPSVTSTRSTRAPAVAGTLTPGREGRGSGLQRLHLHHSRPGL